MDEKYIQQLYADLQSRYGKGKVIPYSDFASKVKVDTTYQRQLHDDISAAYGKDKVIGYDDFTQKVAAPKPQPQNVVIDNRPSIMSTLPKQKDLPIASGDIRNMPGVINESHPAVQIDKLAQRLPTLKKKVVKDITESNLIKKLKVAPEGSPDYEAEKKAVEDNISDSDWMPSYFTQPTLEQIKSGAVKNFAFGNGLKPEEVEAGINDGKYLLEDGKVKVKGGILDNYVQGVKNAMDGIKLGLDVAGAKANRNTDAEANQDIADILDEHSRKQQWGHEYTGTDLLSKAAKGAGEFTPYVAPALLSGVTGIPALGMMDIPAMGASNMGNTINEIWHDDKYKTKEDKLNAIHSKMNDAFMIGAAQATVFHGVGAKDVKPTVGEMLGKYEPTSRLKYKFAQNLYNNIGTLIKAQPKGIAESAANFSGTEFLNQVNKANSVGEVDLSKIPEQGLAGAELHLMMQAPKALVGAYRTIKEAVKTGYDKINPQWYNQYNKTAQDALNDIVSLPEPLYKQAIDQLDNVKDSDPNVANAKQKIETFRQYHNSLPSDMSPEAKGKALHILQLKTEAMDDASNAPDSGISKIYEGRASAYDGLLQKLVEKGNLDTKKEPLLIDRFIAPANNKKEEDITSPENQPTNEKAQEAQTEEVNDTPPTSGASETIPADEIQSQEQGNQEGVQPSVEGAGQGDAANGDALLDAKKNAAQKIADAFRSRFGIKMKVLSNEDADALLNTRDHKAFFFKVLDDVDVFDSKDPNEAKKFITQAFQTVDSPEDAKKAYRRLAIKYHPDKQGSEEIMKHLNDVYDKYQTGKLNGGESKSSSSANQDQKYKEWSERMYRQAQEDARRYEEQFQEFRKKHFNDDFAQQEQQRRAKQQQQRSSQANSQSFWSKVKDAFGSKAEILTPERRDKIIDGLRKKRDNDIDNLRNKRNSEIERHSQRRKEKDKYASYAEMQKNASQYFKDKAQAETDFITQKEKIEKGFLAEKDKIEKAYYGKKPYRQYSEGRVAGMYDAVAKEAYFLYERADDTTAIHEAFSHPFIEAVESKNKQLYDNLLNEAKRDKQVAEHIDRNYEGESQQRKDKEYIAHAIDLEAKGQLKNDSLIDYIKKFWGEVSAIVKDIFGGKDARIENIHANTTIKELVDFVLKSNKKLELNEEPDTQLATNETPAENNTENKPGNESPKAEIAPATEVNTEGQEAKDGGGEPPKGDEPTVIHHDDGTVELSHKGLQKVAEEFGLSDVKKRTRKSDEKLFADADNTIKQWVSEGSYANNIREKIDLAKEGKISDEERVILEKHLSTLRAEAKGMDIYSKEYDAKIAQIAEVKEAGEKARSEAGAQLRLPKQGGSHTLDDVDTAMENAMAERASVNKTDKLTEAQKKEVEKLVDEYKQIAENETQKRKDIEEIYENFLAEKEVEKTKKNIYKRVKRDYDKETADILSSIKDKWKKAANDGTLTAVPLPYFKQLMAISPDVAKLMEVLLSKGVDKLDDLVKDIHGRLKDAIPEITERDIRDIIKGDYNPKKETRNELKAKAHEIRQEQKLLDEYDRVLRGEAKTERQKQVKNEKLTELRKKIKTKIKEDDIESKRVQKIKDLQDELDRVSKRREKEKVEKGSNADKDISEQEKSLIEKIDAEQEAWNAEKDAARKSKRQYQKMETERNRQLKRVSDLKERLDTLQKGKLPETESKQPKVDTPEIESLKKEIAHADKAVRESISKEERLNELEADLQRIKDRKLKEKKPENKKAISEEENTKRAEIDAEQEKWDNEIRVADLEKELKRVQDKRDKEPSTQKKRVLTDRENELIDQIAEQKGVNTLEAELQRVRDRKAKETRPNKKRELSDREKGLLTSIKKEKSIAAKEQELERLKARKEKTKNLKAKEELSEKEKDLDEKINSEKEAWKEEMKDLKSIRAKRDANTRAADKLQERIDNKDFSEKEKPIPLSQNWEFKRRYPSDYIEAMHAIKAKEEKKKEFDLLLLKDKMAKRNFAQKAADVAIMVKNTSVSIVAGVDNSIAFVQLWTMLLKHPREAFNFKIYKNERGQTRFKLGGALTDSWIDAASKARFEREMTALHESGFEWRLLHESGVDILEPKSLMDKMHEEAFQHNFLDKLGVGTINMGKKLSIGDSKLKHLNLGKFAAIWERLYTSLGNNMRRNVFNKLAAELYRDGITFENDAEEFKSIARIVNNESGRGTQAAKIAQATPALTLLTGNWSPKMLSSSLNLLGLSDLAMGKSGGYYSKLTPRARSYAIKTVAHGIGISIGVMGLAAYSGHKVHWDPRDPRFGDIEYDNGKKSFNAFLRFASVIKFIVQLLPSFKMLGHNIGGGVLHDDGTVEDIYDIGGKKAKEVIGGFVRGKANPIYGLGYDYLLNDKTGSFDHKPITLKTAAKSVGVPMSLSNIDELLKKDGSMSVLEFIANFHGIPMRNQLDYYENQWKGQPEGEFLQQHMIKVPATNTQSMKVGKDKSNPEGRKMTSEEADKFIEAKNDIMKQMIAKVIKHGWYSEKGTRISASDIGKTENKKYLEDAIKTIDVIASEKAKEKIFKEKDKNAYEEKDKRLIQKMKKELLFD